MTQGSPVPTLTVTYTGVVNNQDLEDVVSGSPALSTTATASSPPGNYPIAVSQGALASSLYTFSFVPGVLSVLAPPTVQLSVSATLTKQANAYQASITVTNNGNLDAANVVLTAATLGAAGGAPLPQTLSTVKAGGSAAATVSFPLSAGADGASVAAKYGGTYTGGTFSQSFRGVVLP
ncbi:MAG TPA: MBG domain-containing protein [Bryobacteraceae bacterium]|nr:MBG domain-containing protein [Bryobacteraceae bacterium]